MVTATAVETYLNLGLNPIDIECRLFFLVLEHDELTHLVESPNGLEDTGIVLAEP